MTIQLKNVSENNWFSCTQIEVSEEQKEVFPVSNVYWLAESAYCSFNPLAIYWDNELVGFTVYALDPEDENYWIMAFMIDKNHQNKGFGKLAMIKLIAFIKGKHGCNKIILGHRLKNKRASNLYVSLDFKEINQSDHEVIRCLELLD